VTDLEGDSPIITERRRDEPPVHIRDRLLERSERRGDGVPTLHGFRRHRVVHRGVRRVERGHSLHVASVDGVDVSLPRSSAAIGFSSNTRRRDDESIICPMADVDTRVLVQPLPAEPAIPGEVTHVPRVTSHPAYEVFAAAAVGITAT
jgi:hypothetical protein